MKASLLSAVAEEVDETLDCEDNVNYGNPDVGPSHDGPQDSFGIKRSFSFSFIFTNLIFIWILFLWLINNFLREIL